MLIVQQTAPGVLVELKQFDQDGQPTTIITGSGDDRVAHPWAITQFWTDADLNAIGIYRVQEAAVPSGQVVTGYTFQGQGAGIVQVLETTPMPVQEVISDRQFFQALAQQGFITQAEALLAVQIGTIPGGMQPVIDALPADQKFAAEMLLSGATEFQRHYPLVAAFAAANNLTDSQVDDLWRLAASL